MCEGAERCMQFHGDFYEGVGEVFDDCGEGVEVGVEPEGGAVNFK